MPKFFTTKIDEFHAVITGEDVKHISRVLRLGVDSEINLCDCAGFDYMGKISSMTQDAVIADILKKYPCEAEPSVDVQLFMAVPKGDKMNLIVQKCVELGACGITPVLTKRCVSRPDSKAATAKIERWQKVATEAAKQCGRGILPTVHPLMTFDAAIAAMSQMDSGILFYEKGGISLESTFCNTTKTLGLFVGSEGGFEESEVQAARQAGLHIAGLGKRILRCETAPMAAISVVMYLTGNLN